MVATCFTKELIRRESRRKTSESLLVQSIELTTFTRTFALQQGLSIGKRLAACHSAPAPLVDNKQVRGSEVVNTTTRTAEDIVLYL